MRVSAYAFKALSIDHASGLRLIDHSGREYLDACSGTFNVGLGYGHQAVDSAIRRILDRGLLHGSSSLQSASIEEAEHQLASIAPSGLDRVHLKGCTGGSTAVEQALRHAWAWTGRTRVVGFVGAHHGQTIAASLVSGMKFRKSRLSHISLPTSSVPAPDCYRCPFGKTESNCQLECADAVIHAASTKADKAAAFIAEPVLGAGGGIIPSRRFWLRVSEGLEREGIPLILDEVQTFGRLNGFLATDYYMIRPKMVVLAKSISGIGLPGAGALLLPRRMCVLEEGERSLTWGGSSIVAAAVASTIAVMKGDGFFSSVQKMGERLSEGLLRLMAKSRFIGCVRSVGLMSGVEVVRSRESREPFPELASAVVDECKEQGLLVRQSEYGRGSFIKIRPALVSTDDDIQEILGRLDFALRRCEDRR